MTFSTSLKTSVVGFKGGDAFRQKVATAINEELIKAAIELEQASPIGASGKLTQSWDIIPATVNNLKGEITNKAPNAFFRIVGRGPGKFVPWRKGSLLEKWARLKGIPAYVVSRKIAEEGTERFKQGASGNILKADPLTGKLTPASPIKKAERRITLRLKKLKINN